MSPKKCRMAVILSKSASKRCSGPGIASLLWKYSRRITATGGGMASVDLRDCFITARGSFSTLEVVQYIVGKHQYMQRGNISTVARWVDKIPRKSIWKNCDRGARAYCFRSDIFIFLFFGFLKEPLRFSQKSPLFWASNTHLGIYFYRVQFWKVLIFRVSLKTSGPSTTIKHISEYTFWNNISREEVIQDSGGEFLLSHVWTLIMT